MANRIPDSEDLQITQNPRPAPPATGVADVSVLPNQGTDGVPVNLPVAPNNPSTLGNLSPSEAQSLIASDQPAIRPHATISYPSIPDALGGGIDAVDAALRERVAAEMRHQDGSLISDIYAVGELQRALRSTNNRHIRQNVPQGNQLQVNPNPPPNALGEYMQQQREQATRQTVIPPELNNGFTGVTRTLADGAPLSPASEAAIQDVTYNVNAFDRVVGGGLQALESLPSFIRPPFATLGLDSSPEGIRDSRENLSTLLTTGRVSAERGLGAIGEVPQQFFERLQEVGPVGLFTDTYFNVTRPLAEAFLGPITPTNRDSFPQYVQDRIPTPLSPAEEGSEAIAADPGLFEEIVERNPAAQGTIERLGQTLEPTNFAPRQGKYGDFGQGPVGALFYALSLPEGIVSAAAYSATDTIGRLSGLSQNTRTPGSRFVDVLFEGADLSFTQDFTADKYLAFVGNPALGRLPRGSQVGLGFIADLVLGGAADSASDGIKKVVGRQLRSPRLLSRFNRTPTAPPATQLDEAIQRSANEVVRRPSIPGEDISRLDVKVNNALRDAAVATDNPRLVPDLDEAFRRFGIEDSRPYTLQSAIADLDEQLTIPFVNTKRLSGRAIRRGVQAVAGEAGEILVEPTQELTRLLSLDDRIVQIQQLVDTSTRRAAEVVAAPEEVFEQLTLQNHESALRNSIDEYRTTMSRLSMDDAEVAAIRLNRRAESLGVIQVQDNGFIFQPLPDQSYDSILPTVPVSQVEPKNVSSTSEFLMRYRFAPDSVNDLDMMNVRRTDTTIEGLGRLWDVENGSFRQLDTEAEELGNIFRSRALEEQYPNLLSRYGKPVSDRIEAPMVRVNFSPQFDTDDIVTAIPAISPAPFPITVEDVSQVRRRVVSLQRRAAKATAEITNSLLNNDLTRAVRLRTQLDNVTSALKHVYADNPEVAMQTITRSLPDSIRPLGPASDALTPVYVVSEQRFIHENEVLTKLRRDLAEVDRLIQEQRRVVAESPTLERVPVLDEIATRRSQGLTERTATAEVAQPGPGIRIPQLAELIGEQPTSFERVRQFEEFSDLTDEQLRRAIRNDRRLNLSADGTIETVREPPIELASDTFIREGVNSDSLRRVTRALAETDNSSALINVSDGVSLRMNRSGFNVDVSFNVDPDLDEYDLNLGEMRNFLNSFVDRNPNYDYSIRAVESQIDNEPGSLILTALMLDEGPLPDELLRDLKDIAGDKFSKYREYYNMGFRLDSGADSARPLPMRDFAKEIFVDSTDSSMSYRGVRQEVVEELPSAPRTRSPVDVPPEVAAIQRLAEETDNQVPLSSLFQTPEYAALSPEQQDAAIRSLNNFGFITVADADNDLILSLPDELRLVADDVPEPSRAVVPDAPVVEAETLYFHGTKSTTLDAPASSVSNEFGPGLYVSTDQNVARRFARATPALDLVDSTSISPRFTNQGRIFPIELAEDFNAVDIRNLTEAQTNDLRRIFRETLQNRNEPIVSRFQSWSNRHSPHEWWHYVRSQYMRESGGSVSGYIDFSEEVRDQLRLLGYDGIRDGDTLAILNQNKAFQLLPIQDKHASGSIGEGWLNRYAADTEFHNRIKTGTTQAILEQDRLAVDTIARDSLATAVNQQQVIATRATRRYNDAIDQMDEAVLRDSRQRKRTLQTDTIRDSITQTNRTNREVSSIPRIC